MVSKNMICLWYDCDVLDVVNFYVKIFFDSKVIVVYCVLGEYLVGQEGDVLMVEFIVVGILCLGLNGGLQFKYSEVFLFQIVIDDQVEMDWLWDVIVSNGGQESVCGWCKDKWGLLWQIMFCVFIVVFIDLDCVVVKCVFDVMMMMCKIDIVMIEVVWWG